MGVNLKFRQDENLEKTLKRLVTLEDVYLSLAMIDMEFVMCLESDFWEEVVGGLVGKQSPKRPTMSPREKLLIIAAPRYRSQYYSVM